MISKLATEVVVVKMRIMVRDAACIQKPTAQELKVYKCLADVARGPRIFRGPDQALAAETEDI